MAGPGKKNPNRVTVPRAFLAHYANTNVTSSTHTTTTTPVLPQRIESSSTVTISLNLELEQPRLSDIDSRDLVNISEEELGPTINDDENEDDDGDDFDGEPADDFDDVAVEEVSLDESASQLTCSLDSIVTALQRLIIDDVTYSSDEVCHIAKRLIPRLPVLRLNELRSAAVLRVQAYMTCPHPFAGGTGTATQSFDLDGLLKLPDAGR